MQYGIVRLQIKGAMPEKMINIAAKRGIFFQNITQIEKHILQGDVSASDFRKLRPVAKKARCRMHILERTGVVFLFAKWKRRKMFFIGGICSFMLLWMLSNCLSNIELHIPVQVSQQDVLQCLYDNGITIGMWTPAIEDEAVTKALKKTFDEELSWAEVTVQGTTLIVDAADFTKHPQIIPYTEPCDILAKKDGVIVSIDVKNGVKRVDVGQTVMAGERLISGSPEGRLVHAQGNVMASTWYRATQVVSMLDVVRTRTGNKTIATQLELLGWTIPLSSLDCPYAVYDRLQERRMVSLFGKIQLPIALQRDTWLECEETVVQLDSDTALERAKRQAYTKCFQQIPDDAEVQKINFSYENTQNDGICVTIIVECIESIGVLAPIAGG